MHTTFNKPIWVTEFACQNFSGGAQCTWDQVFDFMRKVTAFMDGASFVQEYFAFGECLCIWYVFFLSFSRNPVGAMHDMFNVNPDNQLLGGDGKPTDLGRLYIGA